jgi:hypothetical protein
MRKLEQSYWNSLTNERVASILSVVHATENPLTTLDICREIFGLGSEGVPEKASFELVRKDIKRIRGQLKMLIPNVLLEPWQYQRNSSDDRSKLAEIMVDCIDIQRAELFEIAKSKGIYAGESKRARQQFDSDIHKLRKEGIDVDKHIRNLAIERELKREQKRQSNFEKLINVQEYEDKLALEVMEIIRSTNILRPDKIFKILLEKSDAPIKRISLTNCLSKLRKTGALPLLEVAVFLEYISNGCQSTTRIYGVQFSKIVNIIESMEAKLLAWFRSPHLEAHPWVMALLQGRAYGLDYIPDSDKELSYRSDCVRSERWKDSYTAKFFIEVDGRKCRVEGIDWFVGRGELSNHGIDEDLKRLANYYRNQK